MTRPNGAFFLEVDGLNFHCRLDGQVGAPWLVFSNSLMTDLTLWDAQASRFGKDFRILRYDQRGHGGTDIPAGDCEFGRLADDLAAILTRLDVPAALVVGVSMGGVTALALAARHPQRVARVMACDCQSFATPAGAAAWEERIAVAMAGGMAGLVEPTVARWFRPERIAGAYAGIDAVRRMIGTTPREGFVRAARALQAYDLRPDLPRISCPTLLLAGADDGALPQALGAMARGMPDATFVEIADCGHLPNIERPDHFHAAVATFLGRG